MYTEVSSGNMPPPSGTLPTPAFSSSCKRHSSYGANGFVNKGKNIKIHYPCYILFYYSKGGCKTSLCHTTVTCAFPATGIDLFIRFIGTTCYLHMKLSLLKSKRIQKDMINSIPSAVNASGENRAKQ